MILQDAIRIFSEGIALAEGFYVSGSRAQRNNNPGNLTVDTIGRATGKDGMFVIYATAVDGWEALKRQVELILTDASKYYNSGMTLRQIGQIYASTSPPEEQLAWAKNVASKLGVSIDTPVNTIITTAATGIGFGILIMFGLLWYLSRKDK